LNTLTVKLGEHFALEYERAINPTTSLFIGPALFAGFTSFGPEQAQELGIGAMVGARFFLTGEAPEGLFAGPSLSLGYASASSGGDRRSAMRVSSGAMLGYTWIFFRTFDLSLGAGANYVNVTNQLGGGRVPGPLEATLRVAMGVAF
jgi:hypothetical protein